MPEDSRLNWDERNPSNENDRGRAANQDTPGRGKQERDERDAMKEHDSADEPPPQHDPNSPWMGGG